VIRVVDFDFSGLVLPVLSPEPPSAEGDPTFIFADFILALTRVKNEALSAFDKTEILSVVPSEWQPEDWTETGGLALAISFNDGVKLTKTEQILLEIAAELEVLVERECEFRDFLVCDAISVGMTYTVTNDGTLNSKRLLPGSRKRVIDENVVFTVTGSGSYFVPSVLFSLVLLVLSFL
jgi:hypothetical protein